MTIIDGKECAKKLRAKIKDFVQGIYEGNNIRPKLVVIQVGNNEASNRYVRNKEKACEEVGIISETKHFDENTQAWELIAEIEKLNEDERYQLKWWSKNKTIVENKENKLTKK